MPVRNVTPILNVTNVEKSFDWFEILGWTRGFAWNDAGMLPRPAGAPKHLPNGGGALGGQVSTPRGLLRLGLGRAHSLALAVKKLKVLQGPHQSEEQQAGQD